MVCDRCISSVKNIFNKNGYYPQTVSLGKITLAQKISPEDRINIEKQLEQEGFEMLDGEKPILVTKIKSALVTLYNSSEIPEDFKLSRFLTEHFPYDYAHLSRTFSQYEADTLEQYHIKLRIEKAKELLTYNENNVSDVAFHLGYGNIAHFSRQFKKVTGLSPSAYKNHPIGRRSLSEL